MADCGALLLGVSPEDSPELAKSAPANDQGAFPSLYSVVISSELGFLGELDEAFLVRHPRHPARAWSVGLLVRP